MTKTIISTSLPTFPIKMATERDEDETNSSITSSTDEDAVSLCHSEKNDENDKLATTQRVVEEGSDPKFLLCRRSVLKSFVLDDFVVRNQKSAWLALPPVLDPKVNKKRQLNHKNVPIDCEAEASATTTATSSGNLTLEKADVPARRVSFSIIHVRNYDQTIGDNPSVGFGPPISLDWLYEENEPISVDDFEAFRPARRCPRQMMLSCYNRRNLLSHRLGASQEDIKKAEKQANRCKMQRAVTRTFLPMYKIEEKLESARRKLKKMTAPK